MTKPSLIILGSDPAEPELDINPNATFIGNPNHEVAGASRYSAEDIARELRRISTPSDTTPAERAEMNELASMPIRGLRWWPTRRTP